MTDQAPDAEKGKSNQGITQGAIPTDKGEVKADEPIEKKDKPKPTGQLATPFLGPRVQRILKLPGTWWQVLKLAEVSNRTVAVATVFIAIATVFTWWEAHSGSTQTEKIVTAAQNIQSALDTQNQQNQAALDKTLIENRRALRRNLRQSREAMEASNEQSRRSLEETINTSRLDKRAWLGIGQLHINQFEKDKPFKVAIHLSNSGKTPALKVEDWVLWGIEMNPPPPESPGIPLENWFQTVRKYAPMQAIPPQGNYVIHFEIPTNEFALLYAAVNSESHILYMFGEIKYVDISGKFQGSTEFCIYMKVSDKPDLFFCDTHNNLK